MAANLLTFEHAFYTGDYSNVLNSGVEPSERVKELQIRALIAQGHTQEALSRTSQEAGGIYKALHALATKSVAEADELLNSDSIDDPTRHIIALTHATSGDLGRALEILEQTNQLLDASLLKVHILLSLNRNEDAQRVIDATRPWANDHVIFNIAEALTSLRFPETAQKAYFIFEENNSVMQTSSSSLGEAVSQLELRRFPEAATAVEDALKVESDATLATALALALIQDESSKAESLRTKLQLAKYAKSPLIADLKDKEEAFSRISAKFN